jgi:DNA-binding GntR family transcriptional regulator
MEIIGVTRSAFHYLRAKIITGELPAGQKLNENQLSSLLEISRPPLREAFRLLEHEYLVVNIPRKGTYVTNISREDFRQVYQARKMIECYAIDLLKAKNIRDLPQVAAALTQTTDLSLPSNAAPEEKLSYLMAFANFHIRLVESAGNSRLTHFYQAISSNLARYEFMYVFIPGLTRNSQENHQQIMELIRMGAYDQAKEDLSTHINNFVNLLETKIGEERINGQPVSASNP